MIKRACIFCGSASGTSPKYIEEAKTVGQLLASNKVGLVYGGASIGVMGAIADSCLTHGGEVVGVIPASLKERELAHKGLSQIEVVETMHQRKQRMYDISDVFIALPGGMGTLDELCEIITWAQLGIHAKPCYVLNSDGFFDSLLNHFDHCVREGFLSDAHRQLVSEIKSIEELKSLIVLK